MCTLYESIMADTYKLEGRN